MSSFNIGGLLTEYRLYSFSSIIANHINIEHAPLIYDMSNFKRAEYVHTFLTNVLELSASQIWQLTLGDITYILTLLRAKCYTQTPITVNWDCRAHAYADSDGHFLFDQHIDPELANSPEIQIKQCDRKNSELVYSNNYKYSTVMLTHFDKHPIFHVPTLRDQYLLDEMADMDDWNLYNMFSKFLLCCNGNTVEEKKASLNEVNHIHKAREYLTKVNHGIEYSYTLNCMSCGNRPSIKKQLDIYTVLPVIDQESIMNIQYTVLRDFKTYLPEETPLMKALYWHNLIKKEKQERAAKRKLKGG